jgi:SSS family transporter
MQQVLLATFIIYSLFILGVGVWGYRRESLASFAVADRQMGTIMGTGAFVATFISAVTVIGVSGYASQYGWAAAALTCYGYAIGWILLVVAAKRMHQSQLTTIPEFLRIRFESPFLATFSALTIVFLYSITLIVQLLGVAITLHGMLNFAIPVAILVVGIVFVTYTWLGGLVAVVRTDMIEAALLALGVLIGACAVLWKTGGSVITAPPAHLAHFFGGSIQKPTDFIGWALVWGLGIPAQSYYLQRFYASKNQNVARMQIALGGIIIMVLLLSVVVCGVGAAMLIPPDRVGDGAFPYLFKNVIGGWISVPILLAITAAVQSTTAGLLHIVGLFFALDIYKPIARITDEASLLRASRRMTLIFGVATTLLAAYLSTRPLPLITLIAAVSWGGMASTLFVPLFFGLFWRRATKLGAIASSVGGMTLAIFGFALKRAGLLAVHEIYPGLIASFVLMVVISTLTRSNTESVIERFFPKQ